MKTTQKTNVEATDLLSSDIAGTQTPCRFETGEKVTSLDEDVIEPNDIKSSTTEPAFDGTDHYKSEQLGESEIHLTKHHSLSKINTYSTATDKELEVMVGTLIDDGITTSQELSDYDQTLYKVASKRGIIKKLFEGRHLYGMKNVYAKMTDKQLEEEIIRIKIERNLTTIGGLEKTDCTLYHEASTRDLLRNIFGKSIWQRKKHLEGLSDEQVVTLCNQCIDSGVISLTDLCRKDGLLYQESKRRGISRKLFNSKGLTTRREIVDYAGKNKDWWLDLTEKYDSLTDFKRFYTAAYAYLIKNKSMFAFIKQANVERWGKCIGHDLIYYDSHSEMIVANILHASNIKYDAHRQLPFGNKGKQKCDFYLIDKGVYIEVFMCDLKKATELNDTFLLKYAQIRSDKEINYERHELALLSIEAYEHKLWGYHKYIEHIAGKLASIGIETPEAAYDYNLFGHASKIPYNKWTPADAAAYIFSHGGEGVRYLFIKHQPMWRYLKGKNNGIFWRELAIEISRIKGKAVNTRHYKVDLETVKKYIQDNKLTKNAYVKLHQEHKLPDGFPQRPKISFYELLHGVGQKQKFRPDTYELAKEVIQSFKQHNPTVLLTTQAEFERARRSYSDLSIIPALPDHRTAYGNRGWVSWYDFLGSEIPFKCTETYTCIRDKASTMTEEEAAEIFAHHNWNTIKDIPTVIYNNSRINPRWPVIRTLLGCNQ